MPWGPKVQCAFCDRMTNIPAAHMRGVHKKKHCPICGKESLGTEHVYTCGVGRRRSTAEVMQAYLEASLGVGEQP